MLGIGCRSAVAANVYATAGSNAFDDHFSGLDHCINAAALKFVEKFFMRIYGICCYLFHYSSLQKKYFCADKANFATAC
jgi:hypothetical protein